MGRLVTELSKRSNAGVSDLLRVYGRHLFGRFHQGYNGFFNGIKDSFSFLSTVQNVIHVEVRKLYPDAELPEFESTRLAPNHLSMIYRSPRCLGDFAEGLIEGCIAHFGEHIKITRTTEAGGQVVRFDLLKDA